MPMALFSLVATWFICFDHSKNDHLRGHQGILTVSSVCADLFPSSLFEAMTSLFGT